ncbi:conserved Plasmodium protein, unknown function [Plasmodium reichenowi]|uniref:Uncharacterized protein n=1 Tax=Plasmodium reichenowi TaxID=5854 RepID=A0A2P9D5U2_PLARE|nr:conserved Plasmodium protein, unknown function [Plasmodium reichenowi]
MKIESRLDFRNFDGLLPVHIDIDKINEEKKTCKYISGNVNPDIYNKNTNNKLTKVIGGNYIYDIIKENKNENKVLLGNGSSSIVITTLIGPNSNNSIYNKNYEDSLFHIKIKNIQGYRTEREKTFEQVITKLFEKILDQNLYKFQQFSVRVQILYECSFILSSIINSIILNFIYNNISLNYVINSINIGIVDKEKYEQFIKQKYTSSEYTFLENSLKYHINENTDQYQINKDQNLFYTTYNSTYIPKILLDPLDEEIQTYCSSAFCFVIAPDYHKVLSNYLIKNNLGISSDIYNLCKNYACQVSQYIYQQFKKDYKSHLNKIDTYMNNNYFF